MNYATFCKRAAAYIVDSVICTAASYMIGIIATVFFRALGAGEGAQMLWGPLFSLTVSVAIFLTYYVWAESSSWQGTVGKRLFNLRVTDLNGQRLTFLRSLGRNAGKMLSGLLLGIGFLVCLWTEKRQCLHDLLADCVVVDPTPQEKTGCMLSVLIAGGLLFVLFVLFVLAIGFLTAAAFMSAVAP